MNETTRRDRRARICFYDTTVFCLSMNPTDSDHSFCQALLDLNNISWKVVWSEISKAEAPAIDEYLDQLQIIFISEGVVLEIVTSEGIKTAKRENAAAKTKLRRLGLKSRDLSQVMAAVFASSSEFLTRDEDFLDPKNKARRGSAKRLTAVQDFLAKEFRLAVLWPAQGVSELLD